MTNSASLPTSLPVMPIKSSLHWSFRRWWIQDLWWYTSDRNWVSVQRMPRDSVEKMVVRRYSTIGACPQLDSGTIAGVARYLNCQQSRKNYEICIKRFLILVVWNRLLFMAISLIWCMSMGKIHVLIRIGNMHSFVNMEMSYWLLLLISMTGRRMWRSISPIMHSKRWK